MFLTRCKVKIADPVKAARTKDALKQLGYQVLVSARGLYLVAGYYVVTSSDDPDDFSDHIDCGENIPLFLDLARMRDNTDKGQLFTNGKQWMRWKKTDKAPDIVTAGFHRATAEEIEEYHKGIGK